MTNNPLATTDPQLDLVLSRRVDIPPEWVWQAWTRPEHIKQWFCPAPWSIADCRVDLCPGGEFHTTMRSPEGQEFPNSGCYLELVENRTLVWTDCLLPGFRPAAQPISGADLFFTGAILLRPEGTGTHYTAIVMHRDAADKQRHEEMGFHEGWSTCLDQLVEYMKGVHGV